MKMIKKEYIKEQFKKLEKQLNQKTLRERALVLFSAIFLIFYIWKTLVFGYLSSFTESSTESKEQLLSQINRIEGQIDSLSNAIGRDSTSQLETHFQDLVKQNTLLHQKIMEYNKGLSANSDMINLLKNLLQDNPRIKLSKISSIPDKTMFEKSAGFQIYQKGIMVEFEGRYIDTLTFLHQIETQSSKIFWDELRYQVTHYPLGKVSIRFHTAGESEGWLNV